MASSTIWEKKSDANNAIDQASGLLQFASKCADVTGERQQRKRSRANSKFRSRRNSTCRSATTLRQTRTLSPSAAIRGPDRGRSMRCAGGLIPSCAKDEKIGYSAINARAETVDTVASFCGAFKKRRCLIPADGFYEWKKVTVLQTPKTEPSFVARSSSLRPRLA